MSVDTFLEFIIGITFMTEVCIVSGRKAPTRKMFIASYIIIHSTIYEALLNLNKFDAFLSIFCVQRAISFLCNIPYMLMKPTRICRNVWSGQKASLVDKLARFCFR